LGWPGEKLRLSLPRFRGHRRGERILWRADDHEKVTQVLLAKWMSRIQRLAEGDGGHPHILRHTFCSRLVMVGAPAKAIQELAGHQHLSTTQRYMHLSPAAKSAAIRMLETKEKGATGWRRENLQPITQWFQPLDWPGRQDLNLSPLPSCPPSPGHRAERLDRGSRELGQLHR
jgi:integrase-like protein